MSRDRKPANFPTVPRALGLSPEDRKKALRFVASTRVCQARVLRRIDGKDVLEPCGAPRARNVGTHLIPLCAGHAEDEDVPRWLRRELRYEVRVGLIEWIAACRRFVAASGRATCPSCGCGVLRCAIRWEGGEGVCAPAGTVPGHRVCSGCVSVLQLEVKVAHASVADPATEQVGRGGRRGVVAGAGRVGGTEPVVRGGEGLDAAAGRPAIEVAAASVGPASARRPDEGRAAGDGDEGEKREGDGGASSHRPGVYVRLPAAP